MDSTFGDVETVAQQCAKNASIDFEKVAACTNSRTGNQLQHAYAVQTEQTKPAQAFVPWVTLNGNHTEEIQDLAQTNLIALICETYKVNFVKHSELQDYEFSIVFRALIHPIDVKRCYNQLFPMERFYTSETLRIYDAIVFFSEINHERKL